VSPPRPGLQAVLFDYGHTLIHFDDRPHSALISAYEQVNHLLAETLSQAIPAADRRFDEHLARLADKEGTS